MDQKIEMRRGLYSDVTAIRDLTRAAYAKWVNLIGREPRPMTADYGAAILKHRFDLIFVEGALAGLIETVIQFENLLIENVAVLPSFQRRGLGRTLLAHAEALAASSGVKQIKLYTNQRFAENIDLYARLGYRVEREEPMAGGIAVHMTKNLSPHEE